MCFDAVEDACLVPCINPCACVPVSCRAGPPACIPSSPSSCFTLFGTRVQTRANRRSSMPVAQHRHQHRYRSTTRILQRSRPGPPGPQLWPHGPSHCRPRHHQSLCRDCIDQLDLVCFVATTSHTMPAPAPFPARERDSPERPPLTENLLPPPDMRAWNMPRSRLH